MKWTIPAKTFLLGEYVAVAQGPAILLTTEPCFEVSLGQKNTLDGIHPDAPAARLLRDQGDNHHLKWFDPYQGLGGMGASSAQFIGAFFANHQHKTELGRQELLDSYYQYAWSGEGLRPSGYDVLAQLASGIVYINQSENHLMSFKWPFDDLAFVLIHTGQKLATHQHLQAQSLPTRLDDLADIAEAGKNAFDKADGFKLVTAVNAYYEELIKQKLVAQHTIDLIRHFKKNPKLLAAKGCGALGADVVLLLISKENCGDFCAELRASGVNILATHHDLYRKTDLSENFVPKTLEILA